MKRLLALAVTSIGLALLPACTTLDKVSELGTSVGVATGALSENQAQSINRTASAVGKTFDDITPEQEYYVGRTVAAVLTTSYPPLDRPSLNDYLNTIGQTLALASDRPETFGGYHFLALESDEINAFAAPGGLILVTRGMIRCCQTEDALAAVLAHEIAHVTHKHGLQSIKKSRVTSALTTLATESAKQLGGEQLAELTRTFEASITDITSTLVNNGYSRGFEREADASAVQLLQRVGYDPRALVAMLKEMDRRLQPNDKGFAKTHPRPRDRIADIERMLPRNPKGPPTAPGRPARFQQAVGNL